jgi:hypothetical protein
VIFFLLGHRLAFLVLVLGGWSLLSCFIYVLLVKVISSSPSARDWKGFELRLLRCVLVGGEGGVVACSGGLVIRC